MNVSPIGFQLGYLGTIPQVAGLKVQALDVWFAPYEEAGSAGFPPDCTVLCWE